jgi:hypothetical protein
MAIGNLTTFDLAELPGNIAMSLWTAFVQIYSDFINLLPGIIVAILILIIGWLIAKIFEKIVVKGLRKLGVDDWLKKNKLDKALGKASLTRILGTLTKWYIFMVFLSQIVEWVQLTALQVFLQQALFYLPSLFGAAVIVIIGVFFGEYLKRVSMEMQFPYYELLGGVLKFVVSYIALVIGLQTAGIDATILIQAFTIGLLGVVLTGAIAIGIGFGFALKEEAQKVVKNVKKKI